MAKKTKDINTSAFLTNRKKGSINSRKSKNFTH